MPANVGKVIDERDALLGFITQQRYLLKVTAFGLTEDQLRTVPSQSELSIGALLKHVAYTERSWIDLAIGRTDRPTDYFEQWTLRDVDTSESLLARLDEVGVETAAAIATLELDKFVEAGSEPWFEGTDGWSVRWILFHCIEEAARHVGHADIVRQHLDGATAYPLMAAVEEWPETDWIKPWKPVLLNPVDPTAQ